jgi:hypothetical protein
MGGIGAEASDPRQAVENGPAKENQRAIWPWRLFLLRHDRDAIRR